MWLRPRRRRDRKLALHNKIGRAREQHKRGTNDRTKRLLLEGVVCCYNNERYGLPDNCYSRRRACCSRSDCQAAVPIRLLGDVFLSYQDLAYKCAR